MFSLSELRHDPIIVRLFFALIVLLCMVIVKHFLSPWLIKLLSHLRFQKVRLEEDTLGHLKKPIDTFISLTGTTIALIVSPFVYYTTMAEQVLSIGELHIPLSIISIKIVFKFYLSLVILNSTWMIYEIEQLYEHFFMKLNEQLTLFDNTVFIRYLSRIINVLTITFGIMIALIILVPDLSSVITGVGIGGAAVAFIAKDSLAGVVSGVLLLLDKPFVIGDWVTINDVEGHVEDISFRSTRIRTFSQGLVILPNTVISTATIINWSKMEKRRVRFDLGLSYQTTPEQLQDCVTRIQALLNTFDQIEKETIAVHFTSFGDYSLNIQIIYYTYHTQLAPYLAIQEDVNIKLLKLCDELNVDIAFPTQTILTTNAKL